jgi:chromosome partitioning protein
MKRIYCIANQKGGVGKSTTCACLATALAEKKKKVLMIDLDPQASLTISLGLDPDSFEKTIYDALLSPEETPLKAVILKTNVDGVDLVPANLDLAGAEAELIGEMGWHTSLKEALISDPNEYDFILIDCPPSLGVLTINALTASEQVIVPLQCEYLAMRGLKQLQRTIAKVKRKGNPHLTTMILRTMHDRRTLHSKEVLEEIKTVFGAQVYNAVIKRTVKFADSTVAGQPLLLYASKSEGAEAYRELAQEVLNHA